ncbi:MAG: transferase hexapeptide repeat containing protein [Glaciihabitans sp.]|nr:transferase hexapeptide repeat containing protein [Glaciihabitans sp.]
MNLAELISRARSKLRVRIVKLKCRRVTWGALDSIRGSLTIRGPGQIVIGNGVMFDDASGRPNRLLTFHPDARIEIGDSCYLNGVEIACKVNVSIGARSMLADCLIMDTDFHSISVNRHEAVANVKTGSVSIGKNVWIASKTILLRGVNVGDNSVIAAGSVVAKNVPANVLVAGNPARVVRTLNDL